MPLKSQTSRDLALDVVASFSNDNVEQKLTAGMLLLLRLLLAHIQIACLLLQPTLA